jgi:hypothetical protein
VMIRGQIMMLMMPSYLVAVLNTSNSHWIVSSRIGIAVWGGGYCYSSTGANHHVAVHDDQLPDHDSHDHDGLAQKDDTTTAASDPIGPGIGTSFGITLERFREVCWEWLWSGQQGRSYRT